MKQLRIATVVGFFALVLPALAEKPTITLAPFTPVTITASVAYAGCNGFSVYLAPLPNHNDERVIEFNGYDIVAGPLFITATNTSTSKTVTLNASAPSKEFFSNNGYEFVGTGAQLLFDFPPDVLEAAGLPPIPIITGRTVITFNSAFNVTSITYVGTVQDVCAALE